MPAPTPAENFTLRRSGLRGHDLGGNLPVDGHRYFFRAERIDIRRELVIRGRMHSGKNKFFALVVPAFFSAVVFFVESGYAACDRVFVSARPVIGSGVSEPRGSHPGQPDALKKVPPVNDEIALSEPARTPSRNLAAKEKGAETDARNFRQIAMPTLILAPKISTNLFLSVLNL